MSENAPTNTQEEGEGDVDMSYVEMAQGKSSVMDDFRAAKASGNEAATTAEEAADAKYRVAALPENSLNNVPEKSSNMENASKIISQIDAVVAEWADKTPSSSNNGYKEIADLAKEAYNLLQEWADESTEGLVKKQELAGKLKEIRSVRDMIYNHEMKFAGI